ncbi:MAG: glycoside hydrolase family 31 protein [Arcanobacterium sp.]|nr:glycoside hydrolase family 31 protein [Arcanobacterium sp.]
MKPLFFEHPHDPRVWDVIQWYLGESVLVVPVLAPNVNTWKVYLPEGEWVDPRSGEILRGSADLDVDVSNRAYTPVFVKENAWEELRAVFTAEHP